MNNQQFVAIYTFTYPDGHRVNFLTLNPIMTLWNAFEGDHTDDVHIMQVPKDSIAYSKAFAAEQSWYDVDQPEELMDDPTIVS